MIICLTLLCGYAKAQTRGGDSSPPMPKEISAELFDKAVALIKEFEGWHSAKHYPYIGYGHKLLPHENLIADITKAQADSLLRADLLERYKYFRQYGKRCSAANGIGLQCGIFTLAWLWQTLEE